LAPLRETFFPHVRLRSSRQENIKKQLLTIEYRTTKLRVTNFFC